MSASGIFPAETRVLRSEQSFFAYYNNKRVSKNSDTVDCIKRSYKFDNRANISLRGLTNSAVSQRSEKRRYNKRCFEKHSD